MCERLWHLSLACVLLTVRFVQNRQGQLGHPDEKGGLPARVHGLEGVSIKGLAAGRLHSVAVASDGSLYTWGGAWRAPLPNLDPFRQFVCPPPSRGRAWRSAAAPESIILLKLSTLCYAHAAPRQP